MQENDVIGQIETDKVTIDVRYTPTMPGKITSIDVNVDDTVVLDQVIATVEMSADFAAEAAPKADAEAPKAAEPKKVRRPFPAPSPTHPATLLLPRPSPVQSSLNPPWPSWREEASQCLAAVCDPVGGEKGPPLE